MAGNAMDQKIDRLQNDDSLSRDEKIARLKQIYLDARALQRASNEGGMTAADTPESADDVSHVEDALREMGVDPLEVEDRGASSL